MPTPVDILVNISFIIYQDIWIDNQISAAVRNYLTVLTTYSGHLSFLTYTIPIDSKITNCSLLAFYNNNYTFYSILFYSILALQWPALKAYSNMCGSLRITKITYKDWTNFRTKILGQITWNKKGKKIPPTPRLWTAGHPMSSWGHTRFSTRRDGWHTPKQYHLNTHP